MKPRLQLKRATLLSAFLLAAAAAVAQIPAAAVAERLGYSADAKLLIIHADDLGLAHSVNRATFEALEKGWITSASIMVPCPWFPEAAEFAREHSQLDFGLHLTLTSEWKAYRWGPVSKTPLPSLVDKHGYFPHSDRVLAAQADPAEVQQELRAQMEKARAAGVNFTHVDSHMGTVFRTPALFRVYQDTAREYHVLHLVASAGSPRARPKDEIAHDAIVVTKDLQLHPGIPRKHWLKAYEHMLSQLGPGIYEMIVHPGYDDAELEAITGRLPWGWGAKWRQADFDVVSNPAFQKFVRDQGFILVSWKDLARATQPGAAGAARNPG